MKTRQYNNHIIGHDGLNWVVREERMGTGRDGSQKLVQGEPSYFGNVEAMARHIGNAEMVRMFNDVSNRAMEGIGLILKSEETA